MARDQPHESDRLPRRLAVIYNPTAGSHRRSRFFARVLAELDSIGCRVSVHPTTRRGDAERLAREVSRDLIDAVIAAGGDGTINEVLNGLKGSPRAFGVIPLGTANVFAAEVGLPSAAAELATLLAFGAPTPVHAGLVNERAFALMVGVGFDARVVENVSARMKRLYGKCAYVLEFARQILSFRDQRYVVQVNGTRFEVTSVVVARGRFYAGRHVLAPAADMTTPKFQICLFQGRGPWAAIRYGVALMVNRLHRQSDVAIVAAQEVEISGPPGEVVHGDGDIVARLPLRARLSPTPQWIIMGRADPSRRRPAIARDVRHRRMHGA